jgi:hypothetical protein
MKLLSPPWRGSCTKGNSIEQCEADASYFGMTSLGSLIELKFYSLAKFYSSACHADEGSIYPSCACLNTEVAIYSER